MQTRLRDSLDIRYGDAPELPDTGTATAALVGMAERGSCRRFADRPVGDATIRMLCAVALAAPSKSDLQQRDIIVLRDARTRTALNDLVAEQAWIAAAPAFLVVCANNRRQRLIHHWRGHPFVNDHLDAFFNAAVDAGIALAAFVAAAEAAGLGCCPVSAVRNRAKDVSDLLGLPDHVFPVAGLALGWPAAPPRISPRLPLAVTVHTDRFDETGLAEAVDRYDRGRAAVQPYATRRPAADSGGTVADYGWSEDKARQYSRSERAGFGRFIRNKGFDLS